MASLLLISNIPFAVSGQILWLIYTQISFPFINLVKIFQFFVYIFVNFLTLPAPVRSILLGEIASVEWELRPTDKTWLTWHKAVEQWKYLADHFRHASRNVYCPIPLMPALAFLTLITSQVPSLATSIDIICSSPLAYNGLESRVYQAYTGWLREIHAGMILAKFGKVVKNPLLDLQHGVDWILRTDEKEMKFAVTHAGHTSRMNWDARKKDKTAGDVIILQADHSPGLSVVSEARIEAIISSSSSPAR